MTPAEEAGWKVGDRGVVRYVDPDDYDPFSEGTIVELYKDDGTSLPLFRTIEGHCEYHNCDEKSGAYEFVHNVVRMTETATPDGENDR